jgi:hypothetical protein
VAAIKNYEAVRKAAHDVEILFDQDDGRVHALSNKFHNAPFRKWQSNVRLQVLSSQ